MPTMDELYDTLGAVVKQATGRKWWRKDKIQSPPQFPHAVLFLTDSDGQEKDVVEDAQYEVPLATGESFKQIPWGTAKLKCQIEFVRSARNDSARDAAMRMKLALSLEERFFDLWKIASPSGTIRFIDVAGMFRADIEPRTRLDFAMLSNISGPAPLTGTDIHEIDKLDITVKEESFSGDYEVNETIAIDTN